jgi:DNA-binding response OmpR family regulator
MAKLLVVDDDRDMADTCAEVLRAAGHHVRIGRDGVEGLALLEEQIPDLILLDVEMPELDGPSMAYEMFVHDVGFERIPILLTSGVLDLKTIAAGVGTSYFLGKPFSVKRLLAVVTDALAEHAPPTRQVAERTTARREGSP